MNLKYFLSITLICLCLCTSTFAQNGFVQPSFALPYTCKTSCWSGSSENEPSSTTEAPSTNDDPSLEDADGWIVIQRRQDASVNFTRTWEEYAAGFGDQKGNFWLGLRKLHELTSEKTYKLQIVLKKWDDETRYGNYSSFSIGDEASNFTLSISGFDGDAGDGMEYHDGKEFSTYDRDHSATNCPTIYLGGWWYDNCYKANLNGRYLELSDSDSTGLAWEIWLGDDYSLKYVEMKMKAV